MMGRRLTSRLVIHANQTGKDGGAQGALFRRVQTFYALLFARLGACFIKGARLVFRLMDGDARTKKVKHNFAPRRTIRLYSHTPPAHLASYAYPVPVKRRRRFAATRARKRITSFTFVVEEFDA